MNISQEQLQQVAERLGWHSLCQDSPLDSYWARVDVKHSRSFSDGDLLLAILTRATEMGERIALNKHGYRPDVVRWYIDFEAYSYRGTGPRVNSAGGDTALEAAILAFIQLPASQGDA